MVSKGLFNGFQKQRFGIFQAVVSQWLRHEICWGSAFSHARPKYVFSWVLPGGLRAFKSYVAQRFAGIFLAAVSHGLGTISL